jgi:hypothetical protein
LFAVDAQLPHLSMASPNRHRTGSSSRHGRIDGSRKAGCWYIEALAYTNPSFALYWSYSVFIAVLLPAYQSLLKMSNHLFH